MLNFLHPDTTIPPSRTERGLSSIALVNHDAMFFLPASLFVVYSRIARVRVHKDICLDRHRKSDIVRYNHHLQHVLQNIVIDMADIVGTMMRAEPAACGPANCSASRSPGLWSYW